MEKVKEFIIENDLIKQGEVIGVGVSGGSDSMALLYYLESLQQELDFEVVAIHINHGIREESRDEEDFVMEKCKTLGVRFYKFKIDSLKIARERNESVETAAREGRYEIFKSLIQRGVIDKIALAHHESDQAETILMHIFRGSGLSGARGMDPIRDKIYIRPMLNVSKKEIMKYVIDNNIDFVQDQSNNDNTYNRNFIRNVIMPQICERWPGAESNIVAFGEKISEDDDYINQFISDDAVLYGDGIVRIPVSYFIYSDPLINRLLIRIFKKMGIVKDFERKHIDLIKKLAFNSDNGAKIQLPFDVTAMKEYDYVTLINNYQEKIDYNEKFRKGEINVPYYGNILVRKVKKITQKENSLFVDINKIPNNAVWRFRQEGDVFTKFGGGTKKLKSFLIDRKIPFRLRDYIPVLAVKNEILVIAGIEISDKVKVDNESEIFEIVATKKNI